jgi:hypothetical protein
MFNVLKSASNCRCYYSLIWNNLLMDFRDLRNNKGSKYPINFLIVSIFVFSQAKAQINQGQWSTNGNSATTSTSLGTNNNVPLRIKTNNIERFRVSENGNIGIGTQMPNAKLHVNGNVTLDGLVKLPNMSLVDTNNFQNPLSGFTFISGLDRSLKRVSMGQFQKLLINLNYAPMPGGALSECQLAGGSNLGRWLNGPNKLFTNCPDVNVGIGINNPRSKLDVIGITSSTAISIGADPSTMGNDVFRFRIKGFAVGNNAKLLEINNNVAQVFSVSNQGFVDVNGQIAITSSNNNTKLLVSGSASNTRFLEFKRGNTTFMTINEQGLMSLNGRIELTGNMEIQTNALTPMIIKNSNSKILQLDNNGLLHARRIKVDTDSWADFVFEEDYKLMPLSELEIFIQKNRHLPNVPSEKESIENGVDLVEMNRILLQKVEELTLYLIKQQKEIEELQLKNK